MAAQDASNLPESTLKSEPERELVSWTAPARPFKRRDRQFYVTTFAMAGIISLILFLAEGLVPVLLIVSLVFLYYVLSTVEPPEVEYKITSKGVKVAGNLTSWQITKRFWFSKRFDQMLLVIETSVIPGRLELVINPDLKDRLKKETESYIPYEEVPASGIDRITSWVAEKLPGNR